LPSEEALYESLDQRLAAYVPPATSHVTPTHTMIDLATNDNEVDLVLKGASGIEMD